MILKIKNKSRFIFGLSLIILFIIFIVFITNKIINDNKDYILLTQLHNNSYEQMMGYFIRTSNGKNIVIDGGTPSDSQNLQKYINNNGGKVDLWLLTHYHIDHAGAFSDIVENTNIPIEKIIYLDCKKEMVEEYESMRISQYEIVHKALENERIKDKIEKPYENQVISISPNINIKVISISDNEITYNYGNNLSTVFKINVNDESILIIGDIGKERCDKLLEKNSDELKSTYVQMSHHGQNGATYEFYKKVSPKYCLWPTTDWLWNNDNGGGYNSGTYKTLEVRKWIEELNVEKNYVAKDGDITITIGK